MKRDDLDYLAVFLFLIGFISIISSDFGYTGAFIGVGVATAFPFGIFFMLAGCFLLSGVIPERKREYKIVDEEVKRIIGEYSKGNLTAIQASKQINRLVRIVNVNYTKNREHTIEGRFGTHSIPVKELKRARPLVLSELILAHDNNPKTYEKSKVQFKARKGKKQVVMSTKHYSENLEKEVKEFKKDHKGEF